MSVFRRWFFPASSASKSSRTSDLASSPKQTLGRVLHGRVAKTAHPKVASLPESAKYKHLVGDSGGNDKDANNGTTMFAERRRARDDGLEQKEEIEEEEEDIKEEEEDNDSEDSEAQSTICLPLAKAAYLASPETPPNPRLAPPQSDSEDGSEDDDDETSSEPDVDAEWRLEQIYLNTILNARNEYTLMPSTWKMHFRGIPLPDSLFYIKTKQKSIRPRIYARSDRLEYRGALALRKLIDVHARIQDIRESETTIQYDRQTTKEKKKELIRGMSADMAKQLRRALEQSLDWAKKDGNIDNYGDQFPPNVKIMELNNIPVTDQSNSEVAIQAEMCCLAKEWRSHTSSCEVNGDNSIQLPVIFGFIIMKHIITIVTLDASDPEAVIHVPCQLHMAERNQHQWNALAILVTICWARDVLLEYIGARPDIKPEVKMESSDPDA